MANEIITVGARVKYAFEVSGHEGERPTSGYTTLQNVTEADAVDKSLETIDVSNTQDKTTRYVPGRQDPGGEKKITMNHTDAGIAAWNTLVALANTKKESGLRCWWEYRYPNAQNSYYYCGTPQEIGNSGIQGNSASTLSGSIVFEEDGGWAAHSTEISTTDTTKSVVKGSTATTTVSNAVGTVKVTSSNPAVATGAVATTTLTITGVEAGSAILTLEDANGDSCKVVVTCTAGA